jgi:hypothetical protein
MTWENQDLSIYFSRVAKFTPRKPTRRISRNEASRFSTRQKAGITAGAAAGGLCLIGIIIFLLFCCLRRHRYTTRSNRNSRVELPTRITPDITGLMLNPDGKAPAELEQKAGMSDSAASSSPEHQHADVVVTGHGTILTDHQNAITDTLMQLDSTHPAFRTPGERRNQSSTLPTVYYIASPTHAFTSLRSSPGQDREFPQFEPMGLQSNHPALVPTQMMHDEENDGTEPSSFRARLYPQPLSINRSPSREASGELPPGSAM